MRRWMIVTALVVVGCLGGTGYVVSQPPTFHDYRSAVVEAAQAAHDALHAAALVVGAELDGKATAPYASTVLEDAATSLASACQALGELPPPDVRTTAMRDEVLPLLTESVVRLGDLRRARSDAELRSTMDPLIPLADRLSDFLDRHA